VGALAQKACRKCGNLYGQEAMFCPLDGTTLEARVVTDPYVGVVLGGDVELRTLVGSGAMGSVYRGFQKRTHRDVAVKILHKELTGRDHLVRRFDREAKISAKLRHPHVVEVYFTGELPDGTSFIVMEFLDGQSLASRLSSAGGRLPVDRSLRIARQIADAVGEGHAHGIVHRDLKPENVMLVRRSETDDWVKVLDFGIARADLPDESMETAAGAVFGTARYISPEGAQGTAATPASDVYSLAVVMYQMLAGRTPFDAEAAVGMLVKHVHERPPRLREVAREGGVDVPEALDAFVMRNLEKDPALRLQTGREMAEEIDALAENLGISLAFGRASVLDAGRLSPAAVVAPKRPLPKNESTLALAPTVAPQLIKSDDAERARKVTTIPGEPLSPPRTSDDPTDPPALAPSQTRRGPWVAIVLLTVALLGTIGAYAYERRKLQADQEREEFVNRARNALTDGHYVSPQGENVKDLVDEGLRRWPKDAHLRRLRSDAAQEMVTMAIAARGAGDVVGARNLVRDSILLDPTDNTARFIRAQTEDDLRGISAGTMLNVGSPRLVFEAPAAAKPGARVEMTGQVVPGEKGSKARVTNVRVSIFPNGQTTQGVPTTLTQVDPYNFKVALSAPQPGSYDVSFEATVDGVVVRAMRDLDVAP
jgi:serine/threonine-protein kinase